MMKISGTDIEYRRITTPRAAAIAGILFGLLFGANLVLLRSAIPAAVSAEEALVVDNSGSERLGVTIGFYTAAAGLGAVIGPLLGGWLYDRFDALSVFGSAALLMALGAGLIVLLVREPARELFN